MGNRLEYGGIVGFLVRICIPSNHQFRYYKGMRKSVHLLILTQDGGTMV